MSDYIDTQNLIFEEIQKIFLKNREHITEVQRTLEKEFIEILKVHSKNYNLIEKKDFTVNPTKYYNIISRVKSVHSFKEKLYRKNLGLQISDSNNLTIENVKRKHKNVKDSIYLLDDIIGLRIVTELKYDCEQVYELIKNENDYFLEKEIIFDRIELENQPEIMKNGLPIFRIKGVFKSVYGFELQIKSKIDEAWGDMDHSIFYKDYSVSPIKNTVQLTMNNVGHLLDKIEDLLFGLRNSELNFKEKKEELDFLNELSGNVFREVKNKLGDNYDLSSIASSIKFIKENSGVKGENSQVKNIKYNFLNLSPQTNICKNYINYRKKNFELLILESLFWFWKKKSNPNFRLNDRTYDRELLRYIDILISNLAINIKNISKLEFITIDKSVISGLVNKFSSFTSFKSLFLETKTIYQILIIDNLLIDPLNEFFEETEYSNENNLKELVKNIYMYTFLNQQLIELITSIEEKYLEFIESNSINECIVVINKKVQDQLNIYKIEENKDYLKEVKFMEQVLRDVLEKIKNLENEN